MATTIKCAWASISEKGTVNGSAGDQTGKEVKVGTYYQFGQNYIIRAKDYNYANRIALKMEQMAANNNVGYSQNDRLSFTTALKKAGGDPSKITTKCNTDCSASVLACVDAAFDYKLGINTSGWTGNMKDILVKTGKFEVHTGTGWTDTCKNLRRGDIILNTNKHVIVALEPKVTVSTKKGYQGAWPVLPARGYFIEGDKGEDVGKVQCLMNWAVPTNLEDDDDYGELTAKAVSQYEEKYGLTVDGSFGKDCLAKAKTIKK